MTKAKRGEDEVVYQGLECVLKGLDRADSLPCGALDLGDAIELVVREDDCALSLTGFGREVAGLLVELA